MHAVPCLILYYIDSNLTSPHPARSNSSPKISPDLSSSRTYTACIYNPAKLPVEAFKFGFTVRLSVAVEFAINIPPNNTPASPLSSLFLFLSPSTSSLLPSFFSSHRPSQPT
ncbi:hypothetical protein TWF718_000550 [Orbilia javanica]|uniref:Uncharacterized protein n=1 Tax=Orbilia javanica TaxID=47235 RepID=A0AAN8MZV1_9PEZI